MLQLHLFKEMVFICFGLGWSLVGARGDHSLVAVVPLVMEHGLRWLRCVGSVTVASGLCSAGSVVVARGLSHPRSLWGSSRTRDGTPEMEPLSPPLAGGFLTTEQPGKPCTETGRNGFVQEKRNHYPYSTITSMLKK